MVSAVSQKLLLDEDNKLETIQDVLASFSAFEDFDFIEANISKTGLESCGNVEGSEYEILHFKRGFMDVIQQLNHSISVNQELFMQMFTKLLTQSPG